MKHKLFTLFFSLVAGMAIANAEVYSGTCGAEGDNLTWSLNTEDSVLTISGIGAMADYSYTTQPWKMRSTSIAKVIINDGVTSIGDSVFYACTSIKSVEIPNSVTSIGKNAFTSCIGLTSITIPDGVTSMGNGVFAYCSNLISLEIPNSVISLGKEAVSNCAKLSYAVIGNSVTSIEHGTFNKCTNLTSVVIGSNVKSIGYIAFSDCNSLTSVEIPNGVTSIADRAFLHCNSLQSITIPQSVTSIGTGICGKCSNLVEINVAADNAKYCSVDNVLFNKGKTILCQYPVGRQGSYIIPNTVTTLGSEAFSGCSGLTSIEIPNTVSKIEYGVFNGCSTLTSIEIPSSVTNIGDYTFYNCAGLTSITNNATTPQFLLSSSVFGGTSTQPAVNKSTCILYVPYESIEAYRATNIWKDFTNIQAIPGTEPCLLASGTCGADGDNLTWELSCDSVLTISGTGKMKNYGWTNSGYINAPWYDNQYTILSIVIEDGVTSIGSHAFYYCTGLTSVTIPHSVTSIGTGAFEECGLTSIEIPNSVTSIGDRAFFDCDLTSIEIPNSVNFIGSSAFEYCINLTGIIIPASVTNIGEYAFLYCSGLESIIVENGNIAYDSRDNCNAIIETSSNKLIAGCKNTTIPNNITTIGRQAFSYCSGLTNATIPNSVISIERAAFSGCSGLTSIISEAVTPPTCSNTVFNEVDKSTCVLYVPAESINAYREATGWSEFTNILPIPGTEPCLIVSGTCGAQGDNLTWELSCDSVLTISGSGDMEDWSWSSPWYEYQEYITSVTIPNSVTSIGDFAFYQCHNLTSIEIPNSVTSIGGFAFYQCNGLTSIVVEYGNPAYDSRDNCNAIIETTSNTLIAGCKNTTIPNSVTSIGDDAFYGCTGLTSVTIPNSVTSIGWAAFEVCLSLTSVTIGNSVTSIGSYAFFSCYNMTSVTIPNSVTGIGEQAFYGCYGLTSITCEAVTPPTCGNEEFINVDKSIPLYVPAQSVAAYQAAPYWSDFTNIQAIPGTEPAPCLLASGTCGAQGDNLTWELSCDSVLTISGTGAMANYESGQDVPWYSNRESITSVIILDGVDSIGSWAFLSCSNLTTITLPESIETIGKGAFYECQSMARIDIPIGVRSIGECAFENCKSLDSIVIPYGVTSIKRQTFSSCSKLTSITIPNSIKSIERFAFSGCTGLNTFEFPDSITSISNHAFSSCNGLTSISIPNSVTYIGDGAFENCRALMSIFVESGNPIYDSRDNCNAIIETSTNTLISGCKNTIIPSNIISIGNSAFCGCWGLISLEIPNSVVNIKNQAFSDCIYLKNLIMHNNVTTIENYAFYNCLSLTSVTLPNSVINIGDYAFTGCYGLTSITCEPVSPPICGENVFNSVPKSIPLYVPYESIAAYQAANGWSEFTNILPIPGTEPCLIVSGTCGAQGDNLTWELSCDSVLTINGTGAMDNWDRGNSPWYENRENILSVDIKSGVTNIGQYAFQGCSNLTNITIPNTVKRIGHQAFYSCTSLSYIDIPNSVTNIGFYAFSSCHSLTSIEIPNSVTNIGEFAFGACIGLTSIEIPNSVISIGNGSFSGCYGLKSIVVKNGNPTYDSRDNCNAIIETSSNTLIAGCKNTIIPNSVTSIGFSAFSNCNSLASIAIPNSVTSIERSAFAGCSGLISMVIPNSVTNIGEFAFDNCSSMTSISLPNSVTNIGGNAFSRCGSLSSVEIPSSVTNISGGVFQYCSSLTSVTIPNSVTSIGSHAFSDCSSLTSIEIPDSVTSIGNYACYGCGSLVSITNNAITPQYIDASVFGSAGNHPGVNKNTCILYVPAESLSAYQAADGWKEFTNIQAIPCILASGICGAEGDNLTWELSCDSVLTISGMGNMTDWDVASNVPWYSYRNSITSVIIGNSVTNVGNYAFYECSGLTRITIPSGVNYIGSNAFRDCTSLTSVEIPNSVTSIRNSAFWGCNSLTSITIPNSVTSIGSNTFRDCTGLTSIVVEDGNSVYDSRNNCNAIIKTTTNTLVVGCQNTNIPNSVTSIGSSAFERCSALTSITIPNSVTSIGGNAFSSCTGLTSIEIPNSVTSIGQMAFESCSGLTSITISNSVTSIGRETFYNCTGLTSIEIPNSVTSIEKSAFERCSSMMSVTVGISVTSIGDRAFRECTGLTSIEIPNSVTYIGQMAFYNCSDLTFIEIPNSVTSIGDYAFKGCSGLTSAIIGNSVTSIGRETFYNCTGLTSATIGYGVTSIGDKAFYKCSGLTSITCEAIMPPTCDGLNVFKNVDKSIPLYVPYESIAAYQAADGWKDFTNIQPIGSVCYQPISFDWQDGHMHPAGANLWYYWQALNHVPEGNDIRLHVTSTNDEVANKTLNINVDCNDPSIYTTTFDKNDYVDFDHEFLKRLGWPDMIVNITSDKEAHVWAELISDTPRDTLRDTVVAYVCQDSEYMDTITNILHGPIETYTEWYDTLEFNDGFVLKNSITCFQIHPLVKPEILSVESMKALNAAPLLVQGMQLYVDESSIALTAYYRNLGAAVDTIVSIDTVYWAKPYWKADGSLDVKKENPLYMPSFYPKTRDNDTLLLVIKADTCNEIVRDTVVFKLEPYKMIAQNDTLCLDDYALLTENPKTVTFVTDTLGYPRYADSVITYYSYVLPMMYSKDELVVLPEVVAGSAIDTTHANSALKEKMAADATPLTMPVTGIQWQVHVGSAWQEAHGYNIPISATEAELRYVLTTRCGEAASASMHIEFPCKNDTIWWEGDPMTGCDSLIWSFNKDYIFYKDTTYYHDDGETVAGSGCHHYIEVKIKVNKSTSKTLEPVQACDTFYWADADMTITTPGTHTYTWTTRNTAGCDSIVTLDVTIHPTEITRDTLFIVREDTIRFDINAEMDSLFEKPCSRYIFTDTLLTIYGCDSIIKHDVFKIIVDTTIVIPKDSILNLEDLPTDTVQQIIVEPQGEITVNLADIRIGDIIITSDGMHSGQVHGGGNLHAHHVYMEYILNPWGLYASPDRWYAFAVPFDVDIATGISRTCDNKTLVSGTDFLILEYNGLLRALQGKGWSQKLTGTLEPGNFYMLGIDGTCNRWRFEKKEGQPIQGNNNQNFAANGAGDPAYSPQNTGWNGMGNTQLEYSSTLDLLNAGIEYLLTYDNRHGKYDIHNLSLSDVNLFVGQPFFIQAPGDGSFDFYNHSHPHPIPALRAQRAEKPMMSFTLTNETGTAGTDHLYLTLHDDATSTYTIGRDIARMSSNCTTAAQLWCTANGTQLSAHGIQIPASGTTVNISLFAPANGEYLFEMSARAMDGFDVELLYQGAHLTTLYSGQQLTLDLNAGTTNDYSIRIQRKSPTSIENTASKLGDSQKVLIDGRLYIFQDGRIYDAQGKKVK